MSLAKARFSVAVVPRTAFGESMQIPSDASGLTAGWLSDVLAVAPGGPFGPVAQVERQRIGEGVGVMSEIYRLAIRYAPEGRPGPATLVAKAPAGTAEARGLANSYGFYEKEVAFYLDIAPTVSVAAPRCFAAAFDPDSRVFVLLMEDMAAVTPGDQIVGLRDAGRAAKPGDGSAGRLSRPARRRRDRGVWVRRMSGGLSPGAADRIYLCGPGRRVFQYGTRAQRSPDPRHGDAVRGGLSVSGSGLDAELTQAPLD